MPNFLLMDDSANDYCLSGVATPETAMGIAIQLPRGCLTICTLRDAIIPQYAELAFYTPAQHNVARYP